MRHRRTRKRFTMMLVSVCALCLVLLAEDRIEALAPQLKSYAEMKIEGAFDGKARFSIGSIEGGIFSPITLNDIKISDRKKGPVFSSIDLPIVKTNYRVWDLLTKRKDKTLLSMFFFGDSYIDINFEVANKDISGFVRFQRGRSGTLTFKGYASFLSSNKIDFSGSITGDYIDIEIKPSSGVVRARISINEDNSIKTDFKIEHVKIYGFDIACAGSATNTFSPGYSEGELRTDKIILNYSPFLGLFAKYKVSASSFELSSLEMENSFSAKGNIFFKQPQALDMTVLSNNVNLSWLMPIFGVRNAAEILSGTMNSKFDLKGYVNDIRSDIRLEIRKGNMSTLDFDFLSVNFKGEGPILRIEDSKIARESGYFALGGEIDLRKLGKPTLFAGIKMASDDRAVNWDSLDTRSVQGAQEVRMNKKVFEGINVDFTKFLDDERIDEGSRYKDEVKLEYELSSSESLKMMVGSNNDFFGVEHRDKF
ncbi:MAG: hypothetical protein NTZ95_05710 [Candidatus Omnitrophica bacterium]|nr:hypothetical protein [Candidatus Omnitrophota bacterium]